MAKFIEVIPVKYGMDKPKMLINIPLDGWFGKPEFDNPLHVKTPFMFIADAIQGE